MLQDPDLTNSLVGVLARFSLHLVACIVDIEAMFHQVKVAPDDRDVLRFLWWPKDDSSPVWRNVVTHLLHLRPPEPSWGILSSGKVHHLQKLLPPNGHATALKR